MFFRVETIKVSHYIFYPQLFPSPILAFQNHTATFEALQGMPLSHGDAEAEDVTTGFNEDGVRQLALVVVI